MTTLPTPRPRPGETNIGSYRLLAPIGEGGMGVVHLAQGRDGNRVALKVLRPHIVGDREARERLAREGSLGPDIRLSCQIRVESDLTIRVLNRAAATGMTAGPRPAD